MQGYIFMECSHQSLGLPPSPSCFIVRDTDTQFWSPFLTRYAVSFPFHLIAISPELSCWIIFKSWFLSDISRSTYETHFKTAEASVRCSLSDQVSIGVCFSFSRCWTPDILPSSELNHSPQSQLRLVKNIRSCSRLEKAHFCPACRLLFSQSSLPHNSGLGNNHWKGIVKLGNLIRADDNGRAVVHFDGVSERPCRACPSHSLLPVMQLEVIPPKKLFTAKPKGQTCGDKKDFCPFQRALLHSI